MNESDPLADLIARERSIPSASDAAKARVREGIARQIAAGGPPPASDAPATAAGTSTAPAIVISLVTAAAAVTVVLLTLNRPAPAEAPAMREAPASAPHEANGRPDDVAPAPPPTFIEPVEPDAPVLEPEPLDPAEAPIAVPAPEARTPKGPPKAAVDTSFAAEYELIQSIHAALEQRRPARALTLIERHQAIFASGQLVQEREAARVTALCALGREQPAKAAVQRFVKRFPSSSHRAKVERGCSE